MSHAGEELRRLVQAQGASVVDDPSGLRSALADAAPEDVRGRSILALAADAGVGRALGVDASRATRRRLRHMLVADYALTSAAAKWAVDTWAAALCAGGRGGRRPPAAGERWWQRHRLALALAAATLACAAGVWAFLRLSAPTTLQGHAGAVWCVGISPNGRFAVSGGADRTVRLWDLRRRREVRRFGQHARAVRCVAVSQQARRVLSCAGGRAVLWDGASGRELHRFDWPATGRGAPAADVAFSPDSEVAIIGSTRHARFDAVSADGKPIRTFRWAAPTSGRGVAAFHPNGRQVLFAGGAGAGARLWDLERGVVVRRFEVHTPGVTAAAFSPDGRRVATGDLAGTVRIWEVATGRAPLGFDDHRQRILCVGFVEEGRQLLSADAAFVIVRDASEGTRLRRYELVRVLRLRGATVVECIALSKEGGWLVAGCSDGTVRRWSIPG